MKQTVKKVAKFGAMLYIIAMYFIMNGCSKEDTALYEETQNLTATTVNAVETTNTTTFTTPQTPDYKNFYGISWRGTSHDNLAYAKQMKYDYVFYQTGMEKDVLSNDLYFYLETPEYLIYPRTIYTNNSYSSKQKSFYENYCVLKNNTETFPNNVATGWHFSSTAFTPILDFQQQKVITWAVDSIINLAKQIEKKNPKFHFGGLAWDEPIPSGDFYSGVLNPGKRVTLTYWTGGDYGIKATGTTHEFSTYTDGHLEFYKQLYKKVRNLYPTAKFMMEPYRVYDDWIKPTQSRTDAKEFYPDILSEERNSTEIFTDALIFSSSLVTKQSVANTTPDMFSEVENRRFAAIAALQGATFGWYGRFGGTGDMPDYKSINDVLTRLKLIRILPTWENINGTPLTERIWDGTTYRSSTAFADPKAISVLQPRTNKLFVVFLSPLAEVPIPKGKKVASIFKTSTLLIETANGSSDIVQTSNNTLKPTSAYTLGAGYIINLID